MARRKQNYHKKRRKKQNQFVRVLRFFAELLLLCFLIVVLFLTYKYSRMTIEKVKKNEIQISTRISEEEQKKMERYITVPVFLVDGDTERMEDIMILATVEKENGNVRFLSIDSDCWLSDEEGYENQCKEIYETDGPAVLVTRLNNNLKLAMTDYCVLKSCIVREMTDNFKSMRITLEDGEADQINELLRVAGKETIQGDGKVFVNGDQIMAYCRNENSPRHPMDRWSEVAKYLLIRSEMKGLTKANHLTDELLYHVSTSISFSEFCTLLKSLLVYEIRPHGILEGEAAEQVTELQEYLYP